MKINLSQLFVFFLTINLFYACQADMCLSKNQFLQSFDSFTEEIHSKEDDFTEAEIENFTDRYKNIVNNCYKQFKDQLTLKEKQDFWTNSVKSYLKLHNGNIQELFDDDDEDPFNQYVSDEIEEVIKESGDEFSDVISDLIKKEIPNIIDMFINEVTKFNEELKENLDK